MNTTTTSGPVSGSPKSISRSAKTRHFIGRHKVLTAVIVVVAIGGGWYWYSSAGTAVAAPRYVVEKATTGTVIASVSGSGQMQAQATIDIKPQASENVASIPVTVGQKVYAGQLLVQLDTTNERRALTQAQLQLQNAQISLAKLTEAPATTTLLQTQNAVTQAEVSLVDASTTLGKDYQTGFDSLTSAFVDFQNVMNGVQSFVNGNDFGKAQTDPDAYVNLLPTYLRAAAGPYRDDVASTFDAATAAYQQNLADFHATSRNASSQALDALFTETYHTTQTINEAVKASKDFLSYIVNTYPAGQGLSQLPALTNTLQTNFGNYTNTANGDVSSVGNAVNSITSDKTALQNAQLSLGQASSSLATLLAGVDPLDVQSSNLSLQQQQLSVQTAEQNLAADSIRAPVSGIVSAIPSVVGASVSSPAVSMVGNGQLAQMTLNEVDAAKVAIGDKATLAFDALPNLSLAGQVVEIDPVGTVSQGVVSYNVQISLATPNADIKPGMSVSANIVTQADQDVVAVPNAAVVKQGTAAYVLTPAMPLTDAELASSTNGGIPLPVVPNRVPVTVGLSNNTVTEITAGVNVGDQIIVQTIGGTTAASTAARTTATTGGTSVLRGLGGLGGGGARPGN
jgi:multidrug efflux pump subunit AcrA (membrane-fusion protein)